MEHNEVMSRIEDMLTDGVCKMYLILRTSSGDINKVRKALYVELRGDAHIFFRNVFKGKISELKNTKEFRDLISCMEQPDYRECCPFINNTDDKAVFNGLLLNIKNAPYGARSYLDHKNTKQVYGFAIEVTKPDNGRAIYFTKLTAKKMMKSSHSTFLFHEGSLDIIKGHVLGFDEYVDCIYYELEKGENVSIEKSSNSVVPSPEVQPSTIRLPSTNAHQHTLEKVGEKGIYVLYIPNVEDLLALEDLYREKSKKAYDAMLATNEVDITKGVFESRISDKGTAKKIARLWDKGDISKAKFDKIKQTYHSRPDDFSFRIEAGKLIIDSDDGFEEFISLCNKYILRDIDSEDLFTVKDPRPFISKKKSKAAQSQGAGKHKSKALS